MPPILRTAFINASEGAQGGIETIRRTDVAIGTANTEMFSQSARPEATVFVISSGPSTGTPFGTLLAATSLKEAHPEAEFVVVNLGVVSSDVAANNAQISSIVNDVSTDVFDAANGVDLDAIFQSVLNRLQCKKYNYVEKFKAPNTTEFDTSGLESFGRRFSTALPLDGITPLATSVSSGADEVEVLRACQSACSLNFICLGVFLNRSPENSDPFTCYGLSDIGDGTGRITTKPSSSYLRVER